MQAPALGNHMKEMKETSAAFKNIRKYQIVKMWAEKEVEWRGGGEGHHLGGGVTGQSVSGRRA
jgi:hypothetical protein